MRTVIDVNREAIQRLVEAAEAVVGVFEIHGVMFCEALPGIMDVAEGLRDAVFEVKYPTPLARVQAHIESVEAAGLVDSKTLRALRDVYDVARMHGEPGDRVFFTPSPLMDSNRVEETDVKEGVEEGIEPEAVQLPRGVLGDALLFAGGPDIGPLNTGLSG